MKSVKRIMRKKTLFMISSLSLVEIRKTLCSITEFFSWFSLLMNLFQRMKAQICILLISITLKYNDISLCIKWINERGAFDNLHSKIVEKTFRFKLYVMKHKFQTVYWLGDVSKMSENSFVLRNKTKQASKY